MSFALPEKLMIILATHLKTTSIGVERALESLLDLQREVRPEITQDQAFYYVLEGLAWHFEDHYLDFLISDFIHSQHLPEIRCPKVA